MRPLLLLLLCAAPVLAGPGRDPGNIGGSGPQQPRESPQARLEAALAALRTARQQLRRPEAGVPMGELMERAAELRAALEGLPPARDESAQRQRMLLYALTATVETLGAMGDPSALDVADTLLAQGGHVTRHDAALAPPAPQPSAQPGAPAPAPAPSGPTAVPPAPPGPSPGDAWASTPEGAEAVARAQAAPGGGGRGADLGKMNALAGKASRAIGGAFDTKSLGGLGNGLGAGPGSGAMGSLGRGGGFGGTGALRQVAAPTTVSSPADVGALGVAAAGAGHAAFKDLGLKMGTAPDGRAQVQRTDGSPASEADMSALRGRLGTEPEALQKRPDFFSVLSRDAFEALKGRYRSEPGGAWFQHMSLPPPAQRDFIWSASCDKVSGDCNPHAKEPGYRRGDFVAPETLGAVGEAAQRADDAAAGEPGYQGFRAPRATGAAGLGGTHAQESPAAKPAARPAKAAAALLGLLLLLAGAALALRRAEPAA